MKHETDPVIWRRIDHPGHESATLFHNNDAWHLHGTAVFLYKSDACKFDYQIVCDAQWQSRSAIVTGWVGNKTIDSRVVAGPEQRWFLNDEECPQVEGSVDVDLNFSPSTNLLPIRRLNLSVGEAKEVKAAWLRFPSFEFEPLIQIYRRLDENTYRYESAGGKFVRDLTVNSDGFVTNYPELWQIELP